MLVGMATGLNQEISVQDIGLTGLTHADGLAVGRPSGFVGRVLYDYMRDLLGTENIFLEPSACASFEGPIQIERNESARKYLQENHLEEKMKNATHIAWATGGSLVPEAIREEYKNTYLEK